ncbi:DMT family transporter [Aliagarivorans taiwanensis]|uniref:DMT family transporter n=1 Tax=Aliagarivorans taiwanensis TaxID=561966 RepID=UPI0004100A94|nr:DMT family transporter [Aliagarivorans taiwanensis]
MKPLSLGAAMLLLVVGNQIAVFSDVVVKLANNQEAVYQFVFYRQLSALLLLLPCLLWIPRYRGPLGLRWHLLRSHIWLAGAGLMIYVLNNLPLATANAIFYSAPLMMLPLGIWINREKLSLSAWLAALIGFIGVLVIVKPTELNPAALAALGVALTLALNNLLIPRIPTKQNVVIVLLLTNLMGLPSTAALSFAEGHSWDWQLFINASLSTVCILIYAGSCVLAYRSAESNKIAGAEYTGLLGAIVVGVLAFGESLDASLLLGALCIIAPLLWLANRKQDKTPAKEALCNELSNEELNETSSPPEYPANTHQAATREDP